MENTIQSDLIRGHINTIILKVLFDGDRYGYDIVREIEQKSSGQYKLKQPTLYSCLKRLEIQGFIRSYWGAKSNGGRRKYFTLTELGRELFIKNQNEWEYSRTVIDKLISDREVDLSEYNNDAVKSQSHAYEDSAEDEADSDEEFGEEEEAPETYDEVAPTAPEIISDEELDETLKDEDSDEENEELLNSQENEDREDREDESLTTQEDLHESLEENTTSYDDGISDEELSNLLDEIDESADESIESASNEESATEEDDSPIDETYNDVSDEMNELLNAQSDGSSTASYADQLVSEEYNSDNSDRYFSSDDYFNDYFDDNEQTATAGPIATTESRDEYEQKGDEDIVDRESYENAVLEQQHSADDSLEENSQENAQANRPAPPEFIDYHSTYAVPQRSDRDIIESEYRSILGDFLDECFISRQAENKPNRTADEPREPLPDANSAIDPEPIPIETYTSDTTANRKLSDLAVEVREMGTDVKIRTHRSESSKEYNNAFYYYSNKLMLTHYGILFGIMMLEILFSAVLINVIIGKGQASVWYYIASVVIALAFPIFAFICSYKNADKRKRINFTLKNQLIYRFIVLAQCLLIIYCANVIAGMSVAFGIDYLTTLLLPSLMCLNIPISALIFNALYKSGRYSVTD